MVSTQEQFEQVQSVKKSINTASEEVKNQALLAMADHLLADNEEILAANALDMEAAKGKISDVMLDRLYLDARRIEAMATGIREVVGGQILMVCRSSNKQAFLLLLSTKIVCTLVDMIFI